MSLIQDALKRKSEETPESIPIEATDATTPVNDSSDEFGAKKPQPLLIALIILLIIALLGALIGLAFSLIRPATSSRQNTTVIEKPETVIETPVPVTNAPVVVAPPAVIPPPSVEVLKTVPTSTTRIEPVVVEQPVQNPWPELTLTGIAQGDSQSLAIINGKMISAGRKLGEVTIIEVHDRNVIVEYGGERRILYIGE